MKKRGPLCTRWRCYVNFRKDIGPKPSWRHLVIRSDFLANFRRSTRAGSPRGCICGGERPGRGAEQFDPDQRPSVEFRKHSRMDLRLSIIEKAALATIIVSSLVIVSVLFAILATP